MKKIVFIFLLFSHIILVGKTQGLVTTNLPAPVSSLPIKPSRTISFTTDEASNMNVNVSPDGTKIVFDILGDIYMVSVKGGRAKQLTRGLAINNYPTWSPDGKLIALISDATGVGMVHIIDTTGKVLYYLGESNNSLAILTVRPIWLPDSKGVVIADKIFYLYGGQFPIPKKLAGNLIAYSGQGDNIYHRDDFGYVIGKYNSTTGLSTAIATLSRSAIKSKRRTFVNARVSPNGRWVTYLLQEESDGRYGRVEGLMAMDIQTGKQKLLISLDLDYPGSIIFQDYSFSADSKYLFIGYKGKIHRVTVEDGGNTIVNFSADVKVDMGPFNYHKYNAVDDSVHVKYIRSAQRSPDGTKLVFSALNCIYLMDIKTGTKRKLADQNVNQFHPEWSPDGKWIAYVTWSDTSGGQIWRAPLEGGVPEQLTKTGSLFTYPSWSHDGKMLVYGKHPPELNQKTESNGVVEILYLDKRRTSKIFDSVHFLSVPRFAKGDTCIILKPKMKKRVSRLALIDVEDPKLVSVSLDGTRVKVLACGNKIDEEYSAIRSLSLSPDGRFIVYSLNQNLYLVQTNQTGEPVNIYNEKANYTLPLIRFARGGDDPKWEGNGNSIGWTYAGKYYRVNADKVVHAALESAKHTPLKPQEEFLQFINVDVKPEETIAINLTTESHYGRGTIALVNCRIITMKKNIVIENGVVVIKNGRFQKVESYHGEPFSSNVHVIDCSGKTIMPGMIDLHDHLGGGMEIFPQQNMQYLKNLAYGITTARDPSSAHDAFGYEEVIKAGKMVGPRLFSAGGALDPGLIGAFHNSRDARVAVENIARMGGKVIKQYSQPSRLQRQWTLIAAHEYGMNMTNEGSAEFRLVLGMIKDGSTGVEHGVRWGDVYKDILIFLSQSEVTITPTIQAGYGAPTWQKDGLTAGNYYRLKYLLDSTSSFYRFSNNAELFRKVAFDSAVLSLRSQLDVGKTRFSDEVAIYKSMIGNNFRIGIGSHGNTAGIGTHFEMFAIQSGGTSNLDVLKAATIVGAEALGMQKDLGSIEPGKIADLIILDKNPLEDITNTLSLKYVMKSGVLYDKETLNTVWPVNKILGDWKLKSNKTKNDDTLK